MLTWIYPDLCHFADDERFSIVRQAARAVRRTTKYGVVFTVLGLGLLVMVVILAVPGGTFASLFRPWFVFLVFIALALGAWLGAYMFRRDCLVEIRKLANRIGRVHVCLVCGQQLVDVGLERCPECGAFFPDRDVDR